MGFFAIDYAAIPPEVNSIRMYSGPGSAPLRTAAGAWGGLAVELHATANAYQSVVAELTSWSWLGPASQALAAATIPYVAWLASTAAHADGTAAQANAAAAAYETAFAMTVPPSVVAANRAKLMVLIATNVFGQNTAAIAATDALYAEMWAQDAAAMHGYAASAFAASMLPSFAPPPNVANPAGQATQAAGTSGNVVASGVQSALSQVAGQAAVAAPAQGIEDLFTLPSLSDLAGVNALSALSVALSAGAWMAADESTRQILNEQDQVREIEYDILNAIDLFSPLTPSRPIGAVGWSAGLSAGLGDAVTVGKLSVPISWAAAAPEIRSLSYTTPLAGPGLGAGAVPPASLSAMGSAFSQMGLAGMGGSALAGSVSRSRGDAAGPDTAGPNLVGPNTAGPGRAPQAPVVAPLPGAAAAGESEAVPLTGIAAEIREFAELRDRGLITNDEYHEQKMRLLGR